MYVNENDLTKKAQTILEQRIKTSIEIALKAPFQESNKDNVKPYKIDNKYYYLKADIDKTIDSYLNGISSNIANSFKDSIDLKQIPSANIGGREIIGARLYSIEKVNGYIDNLLKGFASGTRK